VSAATASQTTANTRTGMRPIWTCAAGPYREDVLAPNVVDWSVLIVVVAIGVISVATMIVPVIGHRISNRRAPEAAHDRADRTANNSSGHSALDTSCDRAPFVSRGKLR
jgi:hypothetical protein